MTITVDTAQSQPLPTSAGDASEVLSMLYDTVDTIAELDPDLLHSRTPIGHAIVTLAGAARAAAAALGAAPGPTLRDAPGVVVVRELVAAVSVLELATGRRVAAADPRGLQLIARQVRTAYGRYLLAVPTST
jgi:hypothetical protein